MGGALERGCAGCGEETPNPGGAAFARVENRVIATEEMFRGTLTQTSVYPREVVVEALTAQA